MKNATTLINPYWEEVQTCPKEQACRGHYCISMFALPYEQWSSATSLKSMRCREHLCNEYAWSIPDPDSLAFVAHHLGERAIEIGAGTGYWASLLSQLGVDMLCYDLYPPDETGQNIYHSPANEERSRLLGVVRKIFFRVHAGNHLLAAQHPDRTLFLCWPPYDNPMAYDTLKVYTGNKLVLIGEGEGGCTGDDAFFALLNEEWEGMESHTPVQWSGIHDYIEVYERKKQ